MKHQTDTEAADVVARIIAVVGVWLGSITLGEVQTLVGILSGMAVLAYTLANTYVLWRDKIKARK